MPELGVCYYPEQWPESQWEADAREMAEIGLSWVRIGEFAWSQIEPSPGTLQWAWLDRAIEILGRAGLKIILGTPTATPPRWMVDKHPDMLAVDAQGHARKFGSRRHYCFSHLKYREEATRIARLMAERYAKNPHVMAWQIDNEYGCHDTTVSYSASAQAGFRKWLADKYATIDALNTAWGNVFWSMTYATFDDIALPNLTVTEPNPAHVMDFRRFSSDQVVNFNTAQCAAIRAHSDAPVSHNYMGRILDFDHFKVGESLDFATWDSYPLGFLEDRSGAPQDIQLEYLRQGHPDLQAFHHDLYRAVGRGRWWVMEQQPGPVNWARYNPVPLPGMVRLWTWEAVAHGAEVVCYFRWRQAPFAQEQMHAGLKTPDNHPSPFYDEIVEVAKELKTVKDTTRTAKVAIVFDYASAWAWDTQPQGEGFSYFDVVFDYYKALRALGIDIDFVPVNDPDIKAYSVVVISACFATNPDLDAALTTFSGFIIIGPRTFSRHANFEMSPRLPKSTGFDIRIVAVDTVPAHSPVLLNGSGCFKIWHEHVVTSNPVTETTKMGHPAMIKQDNHYYITGWPDETALLRLLADILKAADISTQPMPRGLRRRALGDRDIIVNYGTSPERYEGRHVAPSDIFTKHSRD